MCAADLSITDMNRGTDDLFRSNPVHQQTDRRYVHDGVHHPHLMKMDLRDRNSMGVTFRLRDQMINGKHIFPDFFRQRKMITDQMTDILHGGVGMVMRVSMIMGMVMAVAVSVIMFVPVLVAVSVIMFVLMLVAVGMIMFVIVLAAVSVIMFMFVIVAVFVSVLVVMNIMTLLFLSVHSDLKVGSADPAFFRRLRFRKDAGKTETVQLIHKLFLIRKKF